MSKKPVIWDLCSGLGGWSEAFVQAGWIVVRIDNAPIVQHIPHTFSLDVRNWLDWAYDLPQPDLIVASPPCLEFSQAFHAPGPVARRDGLDFQPDFSILSACKDIIKEFKPTWWAIENVVGSIKPFKPYLGRYKQKVGPFVIWGTIPFLPLSDFIPHSKDIGSAGDPLRSNIRAKIPFEISFELLSCWNSQKTLLEFI